MIVTDHRDPRSQLAPPAATQTVDLLLMIIQ